MNWKNQKNKENNDKNNKQKKIHSKKTNFFRSKIKINNLWMFLCLIFKSQIFFFHLKFKKSDLPNNEKHSNSNSKPYEDPIFQEKESNQKPSLFLQISFGKANRNLWLLFEHPFHLLREHFWLVLKGNHHHLQMHVLIHYYSICLELLTSLKIVSFVCVSELFRIGHFVLKFRKVLEIWNEFWLKDCCVESKKSRNFKKNWKLEKKKKPLDFNWVDNRPNFDCGIGRISTK